MLAHLHRIVRGLPSVLMMAAIFFFSSIPAAELPQLGIFDLVTRKAAHMLGYGLLAVAFWYAFGWKQGRQKHAWLLAVLYAMTDEIHQSFTPGRHPWWADVVIFDALGAYAGLWLAARMVARHKAPPPGDA